MASISCGPGVGTGFEVDYAKLPKADLVLITKSDLLPVLDDFDPAVAEQYLRQLANPAPQLNLSARSGEGLGEWLDWLRARLSEVRAQDAAVGAG